MPFSGYYSRWLVCSPFLVLPYMTFYLSIPSILLPYLVDQALVEINKNYSICLFVMRKTIIHPFLNFVNKHLLGSYYVSLTILETGNAYFLQECVSWNSWSNTVQHNTSPLFLLSHFLVQHRGCSQCITGVAPSEAQGLFPMQHGVIPSAVQGSFPV